jgi:hypothetical protein
VSLIDGSGKACAQPYEYFGRDKKRQELIEGS